MKSYETSPVIIGGMGGSTAAIGDLLPSINRFGFCEVDLTEVCIHDQMRNFSYNQRCMIGMISTIWIKLTLVTMIERAVIIVFYMIIMNANMQSYEYDC